VHIRRVFLLPLLLLAGNGCNCTVAYKRHCLNKTTTTQDTCQANITAAHEYLNKKVLLFCCGCVGVKRVRGDRLNVIDRISVVALADRWHLDATIYK